ncbi:MAG: transposase [Hyphomicrobiales bacterium]|nr:transposase [Hyphomicrobiales bacterium]
MIHGFFLEETLGERVGLSDEEWTLIGPLLPAERGRGCRPAQDNRRYFEGMMWLARTGAQWRHLPDDYGKWSSVFRRYRRWVEVGETGQRCGQMQKRIAEAIGILPCQREPAGYVSEAGCLVSQ